jgi:alginate production protein
LWLLLVLPAWSVAAGQEIGDLRVGHWVRVKGRLVEPGLFEGETVELRDPNDEESLIGTVEELTEDGSRFLLLGQPVFISERTDFEDLGPDELLGARVDVEGHYRGPRKFSAREIQPRSPGRDRIEGRIDSMTVTSKGVELTIMSFRVLLEADAELELERPLERYELAPQRAEQRIFQVRDEDDVQPGAVQITDELSFGGQIEYDVERRDNYNLNDDNRNDRTDTEIVLRGEFLWEPQDDFFALLGFRDTYSVQKEEEEETERELDGNLSELYGYWRDPFELGLDFQVGRQDFDEPREWVYDQNLDALRAHWRWGSARVELSYSTVLADGSRRDRESTNLMAYVSNDDWDRHLAAYVVDRRDGSGESDKPLHFGLRALGEWLPENDVWAELSVLRGYNENDDYEAYGFDLGSTWSPESADPFYFTVGYAFGSGDDDPTDDDDEGFRQTGLQDNNGKFGGVTSFRYYGELFEPELSNMGIVTLGVGAMVARRTSLDLVWHAYRQDHAADFLLDSNLKTQPNGLDRDLGQEVDLILGIRRWRHWDIEAIVGWFDPGDAFDNRDEAWLTALQLRYRF